MHIVHFCCSGVCNLTAQASPYVFGLLKIGCAADSFLRMRKVYYRPQREDRLMRLSLEALGFAANFSNAAVAITPLKNYGTPTVKFAINMVAGSTTVASHVVDKGWDKDAPSLLFTATTIAVHDLVEMNCISNLVNIVAAGTFIAKVIDKYDNSPAVKARVESYLLFFYNKLMPNTVNPASLTPGQKKLKIAIALKEIESIVNELKDIKNLKSIPAMLNSDTILNQYICPITKKPIRFVYTPKESESEETEETQYVFYEGEAIKNWIVQHPTALPPGWPVKLPAPSLADVEPCKLIQKVINKQLEDIKTTMYNLMENYKKILNEGNG